MSRCGEIRESTKYLRSAFQLDSEQEDEPVVMLPQRRCCPSGMRRREGCWAQGGAPSLCEPCAGVTLGDEAESGQ